VQLSLPHKVNFGPWEGAGFSKRWAATADMVLATLASGSELFTSFLPAIAHDRFKDPSCVGDAEWVEGVFQKLCGDMVARVKGPYLELCWWMSWIDCVG
jgi:hypothetical protein